MPSCSAYHQLSLQDPSPKFVVWNLPDTSPNVWVNSKLKNKTKQNNKKNFKVEVKALSLKIVKE